MESSLKGFWIGKLIAVCKTDVGLVRLSDLECPYRAFRLSFVQTGPLGGGTAGYSGVDEVIVGLQPR
jgi:hypothetical protein